jgi:hypothetical protein
MLSVATKEIGLTGEAAEDGQGCIQNRDENRHKGSNEANEIIRLSSKENGHTGKDEAKEKASSIAHENRGL